jgi:hypothetical protein
MFGFFGACSAILFSFQDGLSGELALPERYRSAAIEKVSNTVQPRGMTS